MSLWVWLGIALLGGVGAIARFLIDGLISRAASAELPVGTFVINVSGAFALGLVSGLAVTGDALILVGTATLGSYTTFSTWMFESQRLRDDGLFKAALGNVVISLAVGFAAVALGHAIGVQL
jgi:fluoride exporter